MVEDEDYSRARRILIESGEGAGLKPAAAD
jgi:hypothetical protein